MMRVALALAIALPAVVGCSSSATDAPTVVTPFYALEFVVKAVAGDHFAVTSLARPGQEPHDLELSLRETAEVDDAALVVYERGFQGAVDDAVDAADPDHVVDAAELAGLEEVDGQPDPHFWLDPTRLVPVAEAVRDQLADIDPSHAEDYAANFETVARELSDLDRQLTQGLADCTRRTIVVSHDAFGYLGRRYDLQVEAINGLSPDAEPSPAHIQELRELIEKDGITTVFSEELASPALADSLATDLGLSTAVLDPVEGLSDETADEDYVSLMEKNLEVLRQALACG